MKKALPLLALTAAFLTACASMRGVDVNSDPAQTYTINVYNARSSAIMVSYDNGSATRELGTVSSGRTERFVVITAGSPSITVMSRTSGGTMLPSRTVSLIAGQTTSVTIN